MSNPPVHRIVLFSLLVRILAAACTVGAAEVEVPSYQVLKHFGDVPGDGATPWGSLMSDGSTLYGMCSAGGQFGKGMIFKLNNNGSGYAPVYSFSGGANNGDTPYDGLTMAGSMLYGMTASGGSGDLGVIFKVAPDGQGFTVLHSFSGGLDGYGPEGNVVVGGSTLYGVTPHGLAPSDNGAVFKMNLDGTAFSTLHGFSGGTNDGRRAFGTLSLVGTTLYGMTARGGSTSGGILFRVNTDGTGFTLLHDFTGGENDGSVPFGSLTVAGSRMYGMTFQGGDNDAGVVFEMNLDGTGFNLLHEFAGGPEDGSDPSASLCLVGSTLYGLTERGGDADLGVMFQLQTDGSGFSLLHEFAGGPSDGSEPTGDLIVNGSMLYGMTPFGGENGWGTIFSYQIPQIPEPGSAVLLILGCILLSFRRPRSLAHRMH